MKPPLNIAVIFNNINWTSIPQKIANIQAFFSKDFDVTIQPKVSSLLGIPWVLTSETSGIENTPGTTQTVDPAWFDTYVSCFTPDADMVVFCLPQGEVAANRTSIGIMQGKFKGKNPNIVQCCIFGINENDHGYVQMVDQGNAFELFCEHEISHALYLIQNVPDNTHLYFYSGQPTKVLDDLANGTLTKMKNLIALLKQLVLELTTEVNQTIMKLPSQVNGTGVVVGASPIIPPVKPVQPTVLLWDNVANCTHSVRVLCDEMGLNLNEKDLINACIDQESGCLNYKADGTPVECKNLNPDGTLASTDWGICQINDSFHIGAGKDFSTVAFVLANPEQAVRYMISMYLAGRLSMWVSYSSGAYLKYMPK